MNLDSMCGLILGALLLTAAGSQAAEAGPQAVAGPNASGVYHEGEIIDEPWLAQMRGGFDIAGIEMHFGATMQTVVDATRLTTVMTFTRSGAQLVSQTVSSAADVPVLRIGQLGAAVSEITPSTINLSGLAQSSGVVVNDNKGFTAALHNITENAIISSVISNASGRDIRQRIDINIHIANMAELRAAALRSSIVESLPR